MSRLGFKSVGVCYGESRLGELDTVPIKDQNFRFPNNEIRIHRMSPNSERCPPLSILQTISSFSVCCKLEPSSNLEPQSPLINLHASCFFELKTAVVLIGEEEVHLVAMPSKQKKFPCFWCYTVPFGLYDACLGMLNLRCLSIVFDLDETLIVANTMKSFEDRIEALRGWIARETDPIRVSGMTAEQKRYGEDRALLKQYTENDTVVDGGKSYQCQLEEVFLLSNGQEKVARPVIRLPEKNVVLTRINPENRDTSVLVRLRPAWEDLRSYLTAKGRKRFEVYVCTMAEKDYALEMWRLLDPEAHLIGSKQLIDRVVCVKSGARKSLLNVFQHGNCHPKMAMVIDDRLKVWEDKDQPRVHVVPPFTPYYAPQAETANAVPVLCVARNVACNVRGGFFKEFDENLLRRISEIFYEDEVVNLPSAPDVSNYLISEDASFVPNNNANAPIGEGMYGPEVAQRLNQLDEKTDTNSASHFMTITRELRSGILQPPLAAVPTFHRSASLRGVLPLEKPSLLGAPFRHDSSSPESDTGTQRRFHLVNPSQDLRHHGSGDPPILSGLPAQLPATLAKPHEGWLDEDVNRGQNDRNSVILHDSDALKPEKQRASQTIHVPQVKNEESRPGNEVQKQKIPITSPLSEVGVPQKQLSSNGMEPSNEIGKLISVPSSLSISVLQEIGRRCSSKVEFRSVVSTSEDLQFSVEVFFTGEKIGTGMGKTRKDAQQQAADSALRSLADNYISYIAPHSGSMDGDLDKLSLGHENGFLWDEGNSGSDELQAQNGLPGESTSEGAEVATGSASYNLAHQRVRKRPYSPRSPSSSPNKQPKEETPHGFRGRLHSSKKMGPLLRESTEIG